MRLTEKSNNTLNGILYYEFIILNQTFLHARILKNWGLQSLNKSMYSASIEAMKRADKLIERILFLEGLPNLQNLGSLRIGESAAEIIENDRTLFIDTQKAAAEAISQLEAEADFVSRQLAEEIQTAVEERIDWLEAQQELIAHLGIENYLQAQMKR